MKNVYFITEINVKGKRLFLETMLIIFFTVMQLSYLHRIFKLESNLIYHQNYDTVIGIT